MISKSGLIIAVLLFNLVFATSANAYIDPNAGGIFLQIIVPIIYGGLAVITLLRKKIIGFIKGLIGRFRNQEIN